MELYIEYVIIDNLVINTLILLCTKATMKLRAKFYRIFLSALLGTAFAVCYPLLGLSNVALFPMKIALGVIMVLILAPYNSVKDFIFSFMFFLIYTLVLGGACIATLLLFGTSIEKLASGGYDIAVPVGVILLIVAFYVSVIIAMARFLSERRDMAPFIREVELRLGKRVLKFNAFIDSGNKLTDRKSGLPVIILSVNLLSKYFSKQELEDLLLFSCKNTSSIFKGVHTISYSTISGEDKKMIVFEADSICIKDKEQEYITNKFMVGVTYKTFSGAIGYDMLLNPAML